MVDGVALSPDGSVLKGEYDGYGCLDGREINESTHEPACYHEACWELAGKPTEYDKPSESASDKGWFFNDKDHAMADPRLATNKKQ
jgi:hypothetical protein